MPRASHPQRLLLPEPSGKSLRAALAALRQLAAAATPDAFDPDRLDRRDPQLIAQVLPLVELLNRHYLRLQVSGLQHLPRGAALLVANHNGGIMGPDLVCTFGTLWRARGAAAPLYGLAHDFAMRHFTPLGQLAQRFGAVRACRTNALRALEAGGQVLVYPGGELEAYRHALRRDQVVLGGRTGFIRVAQQAAVPLVPVVAHGAHRSAYIFHEGRLIARRLGLRRWRLDHFPLAAALPWGLAAGPWLPYLPLPFPIRLRVLPPIHIAADADPAASCARVQSQMQQALDALRREAAEQRR